MMGRTAEHAGQTHEEVADIFRNHVPARRDANRRHVNFDQLKVMVPCRTAALDGHVVHCENAVCGHTLGENVNRT